MYTISMEHDASPITSDTSLDIGLEAKELVTVPKSKFKSLDELGKYDFNDRYYADNEGNVISVKQKSNNNLQGTFMRPYINRDHYVEFVLQDKDKKLKHINAQRIVATLFIPNRDPNKKYVNHKNGNRQDNRVSNLEWVTHSQNVKHSWDHLRKPTSKYKYVRRLPGEKINTTY